MVQLPVRERPRVRTLREGGSVPSRSVNGSGCSQPLSPGKSSIVPEGGSCPSREPRGSGRSTFSGARGKLNVFHRVVPWLLKERDRQDTMECIQEARKGELKGDMKTAVREVTRSLRQAAEQLPCLIKSGRQV